MGYDKAFNTVRGKYYYYNNIHLLRTNHVDGERGTMSGSDDSTRGDPV